MYVEMTEVFLNGAAAVLNSCACTNAQKRGRADESDGNESNEDELPKPVKKMTRAGRKPQLYCRYRTENGEWKKHCETPTAVADKGASRAAFDEAVQRVLAFYKENHHPTDGDEDDV